MTNLLFCLHHFIIQACGADITVLKKDANQVIEIYRTTGIDCGDTSVSNIFVEFLLKIFGSQVMTSLGKEDSSALSDLERNFKGITNRKYICRSNPSDTIQLSIPYCSLNTLCQKHLYKNIEDVISTSIYGKCISLKQDKMRIDPNIIRNLFKSPIDKIINLVDNVFADYKDAHQVIEIVMVGHFAELCLVQDVVKKKNFLIKT